MAVRCITGAKFTMNAEVLRYTGVTTGGVAPGTWANNQDPITGEILNKWEPIKQVDNPDTEVNESAEPPYTINCIARGVVSGGVQAAGTTQKFGDNYQNIDFVHMWTPPHIQLTKRDQVTNIRSKNGQVVWLDEEYIDEEYPDGTRPTIFNVNGVTPIFDPFNRHIENFVLLEKAE